LEDYDVMKIMPKIWIWVLNATMKAILAISGMLPQQIRYFGLTMYLSYVDYVFVA